MNREIKFIQLPTETKNAIIDIYLKAGAVLQLQTLSYTINEWIGILKNKGKFSTKIELELFSILMSSD